MTRTILLREIIVLTHNVKHEQHADIWTRPNRQASFRLGNGSKDGNDYKNWPPGLYADDVFGERAGR